MLHFFRKIRWRLAANNQFFKYSRYAIGEIVLVVIGILIALQINNWNEGRISERNTIQLLQKVQKELILNIQYADDVIGLCRDRDLLTYNINNRIYTIEDYKENRRLPGAIARSTSFTILDNAFNNLMEGENYNTEEFKILINDLKYLYVHVKHEIEMTNQNEVEIVDAFTNYLRSTKDWYSTWYMFDFYNDRYNDEIYNYFLTDPSYFNYVADYTVIATVQKFQQTHLFKAMAIECFESIDTFLSEKKEGHLIISPTAEYEVNDYKHYVGIFEGRWGSSEIRIEGNKLFYYWNGKDGKKFKTDIYPTSETEFTVGLAGEDYLYTLILDENNEVESKLTHIGPDRDLEKKITESPKPNQKQKSSQ